MIFFTYNRQATDKFPPPRIRAKFKIIIVCIFSHFRPSNRPITVTTRITLIKIYNFEFWSQIFPHPYLFYLPFSHCFVRFIYLSPIRRRLSVAQTMIGVVTVWFHSYDSQLLGNAVVTELVANRHRKRDSVYH